MPKQPLIVVGEVIKPHGLAGEFSIVSYVDSLEFFGLAPRLYLRSSPQAQPRLIRVQSFRAHNSRVLLKLEEVKTRDDVDLLRGAEILAREEDMPPRQEGDIYLRELIGAEVFLPDGTPSGALLGRIYAVSDATGQELWTIRTGDGREVFFPAHDDLILEVDLSRNMIRIDPPPGLIDLYLGA